MSGHLTPPHKGSQRNCLGCCSPGQLYWGGVGKLRSQTCWGWPQGLWATAGCTQSPGLYLYHTDRETTMEPNSPGNRPRCLSGQSVACREPTGTLSVLSWTLLLHPTRKASFPLPAPGGGMRTGLRHLR